MPQNRQTLGHESRILLLGALVLLALSLLVIYALRDYDEDDPEFYPYTLTDREQLPGTPFVADLGFDGSDEIVVRTEVIRENSLEVWQLFSGSGQTIDEFKVPIGARSVPSFLNIDGDDETLEIAVGVNRNDSLFLYAYNSSAALARPPLFIATGPPVEEEGGIVHRWNAEAHFALVDVDGDQRSELISVVNSNKGLPRGIYVHDLASGQELGSLQLAPAIERPVHAGDFDGDGQLELIFSSGVPNHGVTLDGLDDADGYLLSIELGLTPRKEWAFEVQTPRTQFAAYTGKFGDRESSTLVAMERLERSTKTHRGKLLQFPLDNSLTREQPSVFPFPDNPVVTAVGDLDQDGVLTLFVVDESDRIHTFSNSTWSPAVAVGAKVLSLGVLEDFPTTGSASLLVTTKAGRSQILDADLRPIAISPRALQEQTIRVEGTVALLSSDGMVLDYGPNPMWRFRRYKEEVGLSLLLTLVLLGGLACFRVGRAATQREERDLAAADFRRDSLAVLTQHDPDMRRVSVALESGFRNENFDLRVWTQSAGLSSTRQLNRLLKRSVGETPERALFARRLNEARDLLQDPDLVLSVSEVAYATGFKDTAHFSKKFSSKFGVPPSEVSRGTK